VSDVALLSAAEVAVRLKVKAPYVYRLGRDGHLPRVVLPGDVVRFHPDDVDAFIDGKRHDRPAARARPTVRSRPNSEIPPRF
jgi:excisionase family DNA binding protein